MLALAEPPLKNPGNQRQVVLTGEAFAIPLQSLAKAAG